jgi:HprK-related kinase B
VEDKFDAPIQACFGPGRFRLAAPLAGVVVLNWKHGGGALSVRRVDLGQRLDLLEALRKEPGVFYLPRAIGGRALLTTEQCLEALRGVPALELSGGSDFEAAARACEEFLDG